MQYQSDLEEDFWASVPLERCHNLLNNKQLLAKSSLAPLHKLPLSVRSKAWPLRWMEVEPRFQAATILGIPLTRKDTTSPRSPLHLITPLPGPFSGVLGLRTFGDWGLGFRGLGFAVTVEDLGLKDVVKLLSNPSSAKHKLFSSSCAARLTPLQSSPCLLKDLESFYRSRIYCPHKAFITHIYIHTHTPYLSLYMYTYVYIYIFIMYMYTTVCIYIYMYVHF